MDPTRRALLEKNGLPWILGQVPRKRVGGSSLALKPY